MNRHRVRCFAVSMSFQQHSWNLMLNSHGDMRGGVYNASRFKYMQIHLKGESFRLHTNS